jgi:2-aminoadipate transaminase
MAHASSLLSRSAKRGESSAIRDLLAQAKRPGMISLAGGLPDASLFPLDQLAEVTDRLIRTHGRTTLQYGLTSGDIHARQALTSLFDDVVDPEELVVTTGSQQGLDLLARVLFDHDDVLVCADPDYVGGLQAFRSHGARPHPVRTTSQGLDTVQLQDALRRGLRPKACYLVPHFHNPTGARMPTDAREHLAELSSHYGFVLIEDDPYRQLFYDGQEPQEVVLDPQLHVRLRSVSKVLAPGLRVGVVHAPLPLRDAIVSAKQSTDLHTSSLTQQIAATAIATDWFAEHVGHLRANYGVRRDVLCSALTRTFGTQARFATPDGGMFIWLEELAGVETSALLNQALLQDVCFVPGAAFAVDGDLRGALRLNFTNSSEDDLREGVARLARAVEACAPVTAPVG